MGELDGKVAIITGAGRRRSIGRGAAIALAGMGCSIVAVGTGRDPATFPDDEKEIGWRDVESEPRRRSQGDGAERVGARGRRFEARPGAKSRRYSRQRTGPSRFPRQTTPLRRRADDRVPLVDLSEEQLRLVLEVKVLGSFFCAQAVSRVLVEQGRGRQHSQRFLDSRQTSEGGTPRTPR